MGVFIVEELSHAMFRGRGAEAKAAGARRDLEPRRAAAPAVPATGALSTGAAAAERPMRRLSAPFL